MIAGRRRGGSGELAQLRPASRAQPRSATAQVLSPLERSTRTEATIAPGQIHQYPLRLKRNESADVIVLQQGVDLVVEAVSPAGAVLEAVDSPNGRSGPEPLTISASTTGTHVVRVRPIAADEPAGKYVLSVEALRDVEATKQWRRARRQARQLAADWLRAHSVPIRNPNAMRAEDAMAPFDALAERVRVMGLGEATHGSREFADLRLSVTRRLVSRHGYRIVTLEQSESRMRELAPYVQGVAPAGPAVTKLLDGGWFGRRSRRELVEWARSWNMAHPADRVHLIGVDARDFAASRAELAAFLPRAYGEKIKARWDAANVELIAADEQSQVFGNSDVDAPTRAFTVELLGMLEHDEPILALRFDTATVRNVIEAARNLAQFSDYNGNFTGAINHNRDWYMAVNVLRALEAAPAGSKVAYWAHNAHVATTSASYQPTGTVLRSALGCAYGSVGATFGEGSFIAQIPNDLEDRLAKNTLPPVGEDGVEAAMTDLGGEGAFVTWPCGTRATGVPAWLAQARPMRWVGGLFTPGEAPSTATRPFKLTSDFDGVFYLPRVTAEDIPTDRPVVPPRARPQS